MLCLSIFCFPYLDSVSDKTFYVFVFGYPASPFRMSLGTTVLNYLAARSNAPSFVYLVSPLGLHSVSHSHCFFSFFIFAIYIQFHTCRLTSVKHVRPIVSDRRPFDGSQTQFSDFFHSFLLFYSNCPWHGFQNLFGFQSFFVVFFLRKKENVATG